MQTALEKEVYQKYQTQDPTVPGPLPSALVFAIYHEIPNEPDKRIYFRPTTPEQPALPRINQILGYELSESDWASPENFVFMNGNKAPDKEWS